MQQNRAVIRLDHIRENALRASAGVRLCAVVKADAYGHGAAEVARALRGVADCFAVALVDEGAKLRLACPSDILVLVPALTEEEAVRGIAAGLGNIQKVRDGEPLGGRTNASAEFETIDDEDFLA